MPWAWYMALWLHDPNATYLNGTPSFRRPYPRDDWLEDVAWNALPLDAMAYVVKAYRLFSKKKGSKWSDEEMEWYETMQAALLEKNNGSNEQPTA